MFDNTSCENGVGYPYFRHTFYECGSKLCLHFRLFKNSVSYFVYVILAMRFKNAINIDMVVNGKDTVCDILWPLADEGMKLYPTAVFEGFRYVNTISLKSVLKTCYIMNSCKILHTKVNQSRSISISTTLMLVGLKIVTYITDNID
jgi:hypothetical protein